MESVQKNSGLRWVVLLTILMNTSFLYLTGYFLPGSPLLQSMEGMMIPGTYFLVMWVVTTFAFVLYGVYQVFHSERDKGMYDDLSIPVILSNLLMSVWVIAYSYQYTTLAFSLLPVMLITAIIALIRIRNERHAYRYSSWVSFPLSLCLGWLLMLATMMVHTRIAPGASHSLMLIAASFLIALAASVIYRDAWIALTVSGSFASVWVHGSGIGTQGAVAALAAGIVLALWGVSYLIRSHQAQKRIPAYSGRSVMKIVR